ncbi:hypothetical protein CERSUDRAFT_113560 [Gelatoporia subvermispora B]|uniref:Uncharacterized protein n=1 Tax=Ceriporiopsis subvermispora (strain B) TaxID=914234 RepID=M2PPI3_CERS8|nr:hypothetical protein CERSUDRAFT_113560 [Gelatoporia subvermispora B]
MEPLAFASLAHVRVLLLPVGNIRKPDFERWAGEIAGFESIRLGDIPSHSKDDRARFMPNPLSSGFLHLSFTTHPAPTSHVPLSLIRPSDFPLGVIGIASCSQTDALSSVLADFNEVVSNLFPEGATYPLAKNCFVFEESDGNTNIDVGNHFPGLVVIPALLGNKQLHIGTLLADLCSNILGEFATVMQALESPLGNEYLNASIFPTLPPPSDLPRSLDHEIRSHDSLPPLPSQHSQPELATTSGALRSKTPLPLKRNSTIASGLMPPRHASLPPPSAKKKPAVIGAASSHGRLFKVTGDLFLLAGRLEDSEIWYSEALALLKGTQDTAWHAAALEGSAVIQIVQAWASTANEPSDVELWSDILDKLKQASALYHRTTPQTESESTFSLLTYLYTHSVLRQALLLFSVWSTKGWGPHAFSMMMHPDGSFYSPLANSSAPSRRRSFHSDLERLTTISGISRAQIASILTQIHGPWLLHLDERERIVVLQALASIYGALGYCRKEAYILREVLGCVMDLIVCGREDETPIRTPNPGLGIRGITFDGEPASQGVIGVREVEPVEGNDSILRVVKQICKIHGVDLEAVKLTYVSDRQDFTTMEGNGFEEAGNVAETTEAPFGWPELQIGIVREALAVAEALPDYPSVAQFSLSSLKTLHEVMSQAEQYQMYQAATRALAIAKRRGDSRTVEYWSGKPIVSLEILPLPLPRLPMEKPLSLLVQEFTSRGHVIAGYTDPFLYNPRRQSGRAQSTLVQGEPFEVVITLRNPFVFDLELQSIRLSTSGVPIESESITLTVPANSYHPVKLSGKALHAGTLVIRGCVVQAPGGAPCEFTLPLATDDEEDKRGGQQNANECDMERVKRSGLDARGWEKRRSRLSGVDLGSTGQGAKPTIRHLECKVIEEQPLLRIRRTSLTHGAVMLYNGETSTIRLVLENVSSLPVDFLALSFDDSTIGPARQTLADDNLPVFETYETEYDLIYRPVFSWDKNQSPHSIHPGEKTTLTLNCFGKVGCTNGTINVSYAYVHRPQANLQKPPDVFHTRQLSFSALVTVYHMLECDSMDILPYPQDAALVAHHGGDDTPELQAMKSVMKIPDAVDWCLFSITVRNTYGIPFQVTFRRHQAGVDDASTTALVPPGSSTRLLIPIKKISLSMEQTTKPVPTLSDKQFVVTKSSLTSAEEHAQRELFWYREELFRTVHGEWKEGGGARQGSLSLRQQRMSMRMLEALRLETTRVQMSLVPCDEGDAGKSIASNQAGTRFLPSSDEFVCLRIKVTNLSPSALVLSLNVNLDPSSHIISQGVLSNIPLGRLGSGDFHESEVPLVFISCGRFDLRVEVESLNSSGDLTQVGRGLLRATVMAS